MKQVKLYNLIFPIWFLLFFPPVIFVTLIGNFVIDSLVIILCFFMFKLGNAQNNLKTFYKKNILPVWKFGFLADIIGALLLFLLVTFDFGAIELPYELSSAISYDPFSNPLAVIIILFAMLISTIFIFIFNYKFTFKDQFENSKLRFKVSLTIAILTMPCTFLLPTKWFYN